MDTNTTTENVRISIDGQNLIGRATTFNTGSRGFRGNGRVVINGKAYQVNANVVEVGSKPTPPTPPAQ